MFRREPHAADDTLSAATEALSRLSDGQRAVLVLRFIDEMSVPEVAAAIGRSVHATESLLVRAKQELRKQYETTKEVER